ncbi:MAG: hypothetical protein NDP13_03410 [Crenarchaeota archaeon]|nr:hypothetical protein [Thermoproteota archaeon]MCR8454017.1 hypothetical protein [Thermoproteota archaeon]MCR8454996.1 hypothetical protein [Thermoproteota archaeon]MCR8470444.1 hypothetical protein [Thermoproteota archaeon]MCR8471461.1 hypothetical protein [Thermoproteota archaeon]
MDEKVWAEFLSALMRYASQIFSSIEEFKNGKLTVEAEGKSSIKIAIWKNARGDLRLHFEFLPTMHIESAMNEQKQVEEKEPKPVSERKSEILPITKEKTPTEVSEELKDLEEFFSRVESTE